MLDSLILKQLFELWHHQNILVNHHSSFASTKPMKEVKPANSFKFLVIEFLIDKALDKTHTVTNNIKHMMVTENTVVLILLDTCLNVKLFNPL